MAFAVKMHSYSLSGALKKRSTAARACSTSPVAADDVGLAECGLPKTPSRSIRRCSSTCDSAYRLPPV